ncbi:MAG: hypothetical protein ACRDTA_07665 [Pseudonocardiaceae bacterium]
MRGWSIALGLLAGSVLTAAYSARFLWGAFARKPGVEPTVPQRPEAGLTLPAWIPALAGPGARTRLPGHRRAGGVLRRRLPTG